MSLPETLIALKDTLSASIKDQQLSFPSPGVTSDGLNWILENVFHADKNTVTVASASVTETPDPSVQLICTYQLFGTVNFDLAFTFTVDDTNSIQTSLEAAYPSAVVAAGALKLEDLLSKLNINLPVVPNLVIDALKISASKDFFGIGTLAFGNRWTISLGANNLDVSQLGMSLGYKPGEGFSGSLTGTVVIDTASFQVQYTMPGDFVVNGVIPSIDFQKLVNAFRSTPFDYPVGFPNLVLNNAAFAVSKTGANYELNVDVGDVNGWGEFEIDIQYIQQNWEFAAGFALHPDWNLSKISSAFNPVKDINFNNTGLVIASFEDKSFAFQNDKVSLPADGIIAGVNIFATLEFPDDASSLGVMGKLIGKEGASLELLAEIPLSGVSNSKFMVALGGSLIIPPTTAESKPPLSLEDPAVFITLQPSFGISGKMNIPVKGQTLQLDGELLVSTTEVGFNAYADTSDLALTNPVGFNGVILEGIGVSLDLEIETLACALALEGVFNLNGNKSNSEVAFKFAVGVEAAYPIYLKAKFPQLDLPTIYTAVMDPGKSLPAVLGQISFQDLLIYWSDENTQLPDGTLLSAGFQFNAHPATFFGFQANAAVQMDFSNGFSGSLDIVNPILIQNGDVLRITKAGDPSQGPKISFSTLQSPYLQASLDATLFKMANTSVSAIISNNGMTFDMHNSIYGYLDSTINLTISASISNFYFAFLSNINVNINCDVTVPSVGGLNIGTLQIRNTGFKGSFNCHLDANGFIMTIQGGIVWEGKSWSMPTVNVTVLPQDLFNIPSLVENQFVSFGGTIFSGLFSDINEYLKLVKDGVLANGDSVVKVLMGVYGKSSDEVISILRYANIHESINLPGHVDTNAPHVDIPQVHIDTPPVHIDTSVTHWDVPHGDGRVWGIHGDIPHSDAGGHTDRNTVPHGDATPTPHGDTTPHIDTPTVHIDV